MLNVKKTAHWLGAEPNWDYLGREYGGLPNPGYDAYVRTYCDIETRATVCVTVGDGADTLLGGLIYADGDGPDEYSWCGYQWDADGTAWELSYGPDADNHWWEIDDLIWGVYGESYLWAVDNITHCVKSGLRMISEIGGMGYGHPEIIAAETCEYWGV